jgi:hypothetical protein
MMLRQTETPDDNSCLTDILLRPAEAHRRLPIQFSFAHVVGLLQSPRATS